MHYVFHGVSDIEINIDDEGKPIPIPQIGQMGFRIPPPKHNPATCGLIREFGDHINRFESRVPSYVLVQCCFYFKHP